MRRVAAKGLPASRLSMSTSSSERSRISSASRRKMRPRSAPVIIGHGPCRNALRAAATAAFTSGWPASAISVSTCSVAGLSVAKRLPLAASHHSPPIKSRFGTAGISFPSGAMEILSSVATLGIFAIRCWATWIGLTAEKLADHAVDPIEGAIGYQTCGRAKGQNRSNVAAPLHRLAGDDDRRNVIVCLERLRLVVTDKLAVVHVDPLDLSFEHDLFRKPDSTFRAMLKVFSASKYQSKFPKLI